MKNFALKILLVALIVVSPITADAAKKNYITIGTGGVTGIYYPLGGAICRLLNKEKDANIKCSVEATGGSIYNLNTIRNGELDLGISQVDRQYESYKGMGHYEKLGPDTKLRTLFALHTEAVTIVAREDSEIETMDDLVDKRVNIGSQGSGTRTTFETIMDKKGWTTKIFKLAAELRSSEQAQALCDNKLDAVFWSVGHPSASIEEATTVCSSKLIPVDDSRMKELVKENSFFSETVIPGGLYNGNDQDTPTFGFQNVMAVSSDLDEEMAYKIVKTVFENIDKLQTFHPVFKTLTPETMVNVNASSAPFHPGALRYYVEKELIKADY